MAKPAPSPHQAVIALFDPTTGSLEALLDGRYITAARTAAASAVSVRHMARPESRVLAILGSGVQAASHFEALSGNMPWPSYPLFDRGGVPPRQGLRRERNFQEVRVWSPTPAHLAQFVRERPEARPTRTAAEAVRGADVVVVATDSVTPAIDSAWVAEGAHVIAIGACRPSQREIDPALVSRARLVVDSRAAALEESGDVVQSIREGLFTADHVPRNWVK